MKRSQYLILILMVFIVAFIVGSLANRGYGAELTQPAVEGPMEGVTAPDIERPAQNPFEGLPALVPATDPDALDAGGYFPSAFTKDDVVPYPVAVYNMQSEAYAMLSLVNQHRASNGVAPLSWDSQLEASAIQRAVECSVYFDHTRTDGSSCFTAFTRGGTRGENIAAGSDSAQGTFNQWKNSSGHNANMLSASYKSIGIACVYTPEGVGRNGYSYSYYWAQNFSSEAGDGARAGVSDGGRYYIVPMIGSAVRSCYLESDAPVYVTYDGSNAIPTVYMAYGGTVSYEAGEVSRDLAAEFSFPAAYLEWHSADASIVGLTGDANSNPVLVGMGHGKTSITGRFPTAPNMNLTFQALVTPVGRVAADTAAGTAAFISAVGFDSADVAIVARADDFADAMSATGLAGVLDAPIILTDRTELSEEAAWALEQLGVKRVYIIGGTGAIKPQVDADLKAAGIAVEPRIWGNASWDTSVACAKKIQELGGNKTGEVVIAMSSNFQDALSISSFAYKYQVPIILEDQSRGAVGALTADAKAFVANNTKGTIYVPGGPGAVNRDTVEGVFGGREIVRIYGDDGFDTSNQIATYMVQNGKLSASSVAVTCGAQAPKGVDALAGSALVGREGGVILLVNGNSALGSSKMQTIIGRDSQGTPAFLTAYKAQNKRTYVLGGSYVVPDATYRAIAHVFE